MTSFLSYPTSPHLPLSIHVCFFKDFSGSRAFKEAEVASYGIVVDNMPTLLDMFLAHIGIPSESGVGDRSTYRLKINADALKLRKIQQVLKRAFSGPPIQRMKCSF